MKSYRRFLMHACTSKCLYLDWFIFLYNNALYQLLDFYAAMINLWNLIRLLPRICANLVIEILFSKDLERPSFIRLANKKRFFFRNALKFYTFFGAK